VHSQPMSESEGTFGGAVTRPDKVCPTCGKQGHVVMKVWSSDNGAYEDLRFECCSRTGGCGCVFWIDGDDG
jgi:hypothetical protein